MNKSKSVNHWSHRHLKLKFSIVNNLKMHYSATKIHASEVINQLGESLQINLNVHDITEKFQYLITNLVYVIYQ